MAGVERRTQRLATRPVAGYWWPSVPSFPRPALLDRDYDLRIELACGRSRISGSDHPPW
jgi:hypothetical protein